jgi:hypothetical protein
MKVQRNIKKVVSEVRDHMELYRKLDMKEDENNIHKMTKLREKNKRL